MSEVSIVVPTYNESANVAELVRRLEQVARHTPIEEVVFVDDSTDDTPAVIAAVAEQSSLSVRLVHRLPHQRDGGLSGAVVRGIEASTAPWVLVMDGDLQHPPESVPALIEASSAMVDVVVASRYRVGGDAAGLAGGFRRWVSTVCTRLTGWVFPVRLRGCSDPMTGFFLVRRSALDLTSLRPKGFKILLEVLARHRLRIAEIPFTFGRRMDGESKATLGQGWRFGSQVARLRWDMWWAPPPSGTARVVRFAMVGLANVLLDVAIFNLLLRFGVDAVAAKLASSGSAVVSSYFMNRAWTWSDRQGIPSVGLPMFIALSAVGVGLSEGSLVVSHYGLGLISTLDDNLSANVVGLLLSSLWRYWSYARWVFPAGPEGQADDPVDSAVTRPGWETEVSPPAV